MRTKEQWLEIYKDILDLTKDRELSLKILELTYLEEKEGKLLEAFEKYVLTHNKQDLAGEYVVGYEKKGSK